LAPATGCATRYLDHRIGGNVGDMSTHPTPLFIRVSWCAAPYDLHGLLLLPELRVAHPPVCHRT
jgi:hypothetical protein